MITMRTWRSECALPRDLNFLKPNGNISFNTGLRITRKTPLYFDILLSLFLSSIEYIFNSLNGSDELKNCTCC